MSLAPPPDSLRINIIRGWKARKDYAAHATEALYSPSRRRRLRRYAKHCFQHMLRNDPGFRSALLPTVNYLLQWRKNLEAAGYEADRTHIRELTEIEAKMKRDFDVLSHNTIIIEQWLPPEKVLDSRFYPAIMKERGRTARLCIRRYNAFGGICSLCQSA